MNKTNYLINQIESYDVDDDENLKHTTKKNRIMKMISKDKKIGKKFVCKNDIDID